jgi:hypothetical protein
MGDESEKAILAHVVAFFMASSDFNGIPIGHLRRLSGNGDPEEFDADLKGLVRAQKIYLNFDPANPHILRFSNKSVEDQIKLLDENGPKAQFCVYPTRFSLAGKIDSDIQHREPFSGVLSLGAPQLHILAFELGAIEYYLNDPKYVVNLTGSQGYISINDESYEASDTAEKDKIHIQRFGLGYGLKGERLAILFLRDLSKITPEHQQRWKTFLYDNDFHVDPTFIKTLILGAWPKKTPVSMTIIDNLKMINELSKAIRGNEFFKTSPGDVIPNSLGPFWIPTTKHFTDFILALFQLTVDDIDKQGFKGAIDFNDENKKPKGSIRLLKEWLCLVRDDLDEKEIRGRLKVLDEFASERAKIHDLKENKIDNGYYALQERWLKSINGCLGDIVQLLIPLAPSGTVKLHDWHTDPTLVEYYGPWVSADIDEY